jgi:hypothetical protein
MSNTVPHHVIEEAQKMANDKKTKVFVFRRPNGWRIQPESETRPALSLIADYVVAPEVQK